MPDIRIYQRSGSSVALSEKQYILVRSCVDSKWAHAHTLTRFRQLTSAFSPPSLIYSVLSSLINAMRDTDDRRSRSPAATRRNGALQSCEPCRRSKQRCDHERPVCRRCAAKRMSDKCFYHPAPMTRRRSLQNANPTVTSSNRFASQPASK